MFKCLPALGGRNAELLAMFRSLFERYEVTGKVQWWLVCSLNLSWKRGQRG